MRHYDSGYVEPVTLRVAIEILMVIAAVAAPVIVAWEIWMKYIR